MVLTEEREYTKTKVGGTTVYETKGKFGRYEITAPSHNIESYTVTFYPFNNKNVPRCENTWDFIPNGEMSIYKRCERLDDCKRYIDEWERRV